MWRINPRGHVGFIRMGGWALVLLVPVCLACAAAAFGLLRGRRWGYQLGIALLLINLTGDVVDAGLGIEPRAVVGVPVVALLVWYLQSSRVRIFFTARPGRIPPT